jgi:hypothetical protein
MSGEPGRIERTWADPLGVRESWEEIRRQA